MNLCSLNLAKSITENRIAWLDTARGIGMVFVVLGHAISDTIMDNSLFSRLFYFIYSFHMPLFFFISGYCGYKAIQCNDKKDYILSRFWRLMVPYFFIGMCYIPLKIVLAKYTSTPVLLNIVLLDMLKGSNPNFQLWTLYALFFDATIVCLLANQKHNEELFLIIFIVLQILTFKFPIGIVKNILYELPFYYVGILCKKHDLIRKSINKRSEIISTVLLIVVNVFVVLSGENYLKIITGYLGIVSVCSIAMQIAKNVNNTFVIIGNYGMDIYVMANAIQVIVRIVFLKVLGVSSIICCLLSTVLGICVPIILSKYIIRRFKLTRKLVLGIN